ncbi:MAG: hypothetical protein ACFE9O_07180 [Promethearchaeota archaeon]
MSDESSHFNFESHHTTGLIQLGYLIQNHQTHPFSLTLQDLNNLFVVGPRAQDIYFNLLIQLHDDHRIPVIVIKGMPSEGLEEQVCEGPLWHLDLEKDGITFNALDLGHGQHTSKQVSILISLFEEFYPLSPTARNLLHVIIWKTILSAAQPSIEYLQNTLPFYHHHGAPYHEIRRLVAALPHDVLKSDYDNVALSRITHLPTIISVTDTPTSVFAMNLLLMKLIAQEENSLPPLFLVNLPALSQKVAQWLFARYRAVKSPLVFIETKVTHSNPIVNQVGNFILANGLDAVLSPLDQRLTERERHFLQLNSDHIAVRLRSEPATRFITIF